MRGGGGALPYKRLVGICRWMGSHFHDWIDYHGVGFSIVLLEWVAQFLIFWVLHIYGYQNVCTVVKSKLIFIFIPKYKVAKLGLRKLHICPKLTNIVFKSSKERL